MDRQNAPAAWAPQERGQRLFEEDRFAEAAEEWTQSLQIDPTNVELLLHRAAAFFYEAEFDQSLADLDRAVELAPADPVPYLRRAEIRSLLDEMAETLPDVNRALELDPKDATLWRLRGVAWYRIARKSRFVRDRIDRQELAGIVNAKAGELPWKKFKILVMTLFWKRSNAEAVRVCQTNEAEARHLHATAEANVSNAENQLREAEEAVSEADRQRNIAQIDYEHACVMTQETEEHRSTVAFRGKTIVDACLSHCGGVEHNVGRDAQALREIASYVEQYTFAR